MASFNTRVQLKNDTSTNWAKATTFTPLAGEVLIYDADTTTPKLKVGDGSSLITNLPFVGNEKVDKVDGKALSTNDFTDAYKTKLDGITASADTVSFSSTLTGGTKIGTITINGSGTDLYAPTAASNALTSSSTIDGGTW